MTRGIVECMSMEQMSYFLSLVSDILVKSGGGIIKLYPTNGSIVFWKWFPETQLWCVT